MEPRPDQLSFEFFDFCISLQGEMHENVVKIDVILMVKIEPISAPSFLDFLRGFDIQYTVKMRIL